MPYVKQVQREKLDDVVKRMAARPYNNCLDLIDTFEWLFGECKVRCDGSLNYVLFKYCKYYIKPSYNNYKMFISVLEYLAYIKCEEVYNLLHDIQIHMQRKSDSNKEYMNSLLNVSGELKECAIEIRRRILANYEDNKIIENGDV